MKKQIKDLQDYFKSKLFRKEFEVTSVHDNYCTVMIDNEYEFHLWTLLGFQLSTTMDSCMSLSFSDTAIKRIHEHLSEHIESARIEAKEKEYEALKKELNH